MHVPRPKAVCVCFRGDDILVGRVFDAVKQETLYGPPGGGIEFGERAVAAVRREMHEELAADIVDVQQIGVLEHLFTYEGQPGHEIAFVFEARLADAALYDQEEFEGVEGLHPYVACWMPLTHFAPGGLPLFPEGIYDLLTERRRQR